MLKISGDNLYLTRGDNATIKLEISSGEETYDFSNDVVKFALKKNVNDRQKLIEKTFDENGQIYITPDDTKDLNFGDYVYDVELQHENGEEIEIATVIVPSTFTIGAEVN